jgi:REP element-mobilizing transposase RayT
VSRQLRNEHPGAVYHVTSRGNARQALFLDATDATAFLTTLARVAADCGWLCHAYCLMENHFHLVVETPRPNLAIGMRRLNSTYAQRFNRRYSRVGHVFQGRYHAILVEKEPHLLEVCRYVVLNPVRAGLCAVPGDWAGSSYRATAGLEPPSPFLTVDWVLAQFSATRPRACMRYVGFVADGVGSRPWQNVRGEIYLGSERFARLESTPNERIAEVPRRQWQPVRRPLDEIFDRHGRQAIGVAYREEGYRLGEIAAHLGLHVSTVSRRLRELASPGMR